MAILNVDRKQCIKMGCLQFNIYVQNKIDIFTNMYVHLSKRKATKSPRVLDGGKRAVSNKEKDNKR